MPLKIVSRFLPIVVLFFFPFFYLYHYAISDQKFSLFIGNDFYPLYYSYKVYLLSSLAQLHFPLWSPSESAGFPFFSSPFTQSFYPLNLLLLPIFIIRNGLSYYEYQLFTIVGISIFSIGTYYWLRSLKFSLLTSVVASIVASSSFQITEIIRFPNAVHTIAWIPYILLCINKLFFFKHKTLPVFSIILLFFLMITAGYPYYVYYSLFLFVPYTFFLFTKTFQIQFQFSQITAIKQKLFLLFISFLIPVIILSPYLYKIFTLLQQTSDRKGNSYEFSTAHAFTPIDTLGSLVFPPVASPEGWYYFGIFPLMIIFIFFISSSVKNIKIIKLFILFWFLVISAISYGKISPLFNILWHYLPGFSHLRVWGRINILLVPLISLLTALSFDYFLKLLNSIYNKSLIIKTFCIYIVIIGIQYYLLKTHQFSDLWKLFFKPGIPIFNESHFLILTSITFLVLLSIIIFKGYLKHPYVFSLIFLFITLIDIGKIGNKQWYLPSPQPNNRLNPDLNLANKESFSTKRYFSSNTISFTSSYNTGVFDTWYFQNYQQFLKQYSSKEVQTILGITEPKKIFLSDTINFSDISSFIKNSQIFKKKNISLLTINSYNGDILDLTFKSSSDGYLSFIDNYDPDWRAYVNNQPVPIHLLFGTFKSVIIKQGVNNIVFKYQPYDFKF